MKLLFLDIDGVLTTDEKLIEKNLIYSFSPICVKNLNTILRTHNVKIILTSSWRTVFDAEKQNQIFQENGVIQMPYGQTPDFGYTNRSEEINAYLNKREIENFVILDDMEIEGFDAHFVRTNPSMGLTEDDLKKVNDILE